MKGRDLRRIRNRLCLTQVELAAALGMTGNTVARMERDETPIMRTTELALTYLSLTAKKSKGGKK